MKNNVDIKRIAIENLDGDIKILALRSRLKKDTSLIETILWDKLNLLYSIDIINTRTYLTYIETMEALEEED